MTIFVVFLNGPVGISCKKSDKDKLLPSLWGGVRLSPKSGHYWEDKLSLRFPVQRKNGSQINGLISTQWVGNEHGFLKPIIPGNFIPMKLCRNLTQPPGRRARCCPWVSTWHLALARQEDRAGPFFLHKGPEGCTCKSQLFWWPWLKVLSSAVWKEATRSSLGSSWGQRGWWCSSTLQEGPKAISEHWSKQRSNHS